MSWKNLSYTKKGAIIGGIVGLVIAIINSFIAGIPGIAIFGYILQPFVKLTNCAGEDCWGKYVLFGDIAFILIGILIGFIIGKIKSKK